MKNKKKKIFKSISICSFLLVGIIPLATSCSTVTTTKLFAELVVSDNTAILKDKSFSEATYNGWRRFMMGTKINPVSGEILESQKPKIDNPVDNSEIYEKEFVAMPDVDIKDNSLGQGRGYWRRPGGERSLTFKQIFKGGANLIIAPGFNHQNPLETVARTPGYEEKGFVFLDGRVKTNFSKGIGYPNVSSFSFRAEQSGFLAGIAAAEFLNINKDVFGGNGGLKIGGYVGLPFPTTTDFLSGFQHGVIAYNLEIIQKKDQTRTPVQWVSLGNQIGTYASGSFSPGEGTQKTRELIEKGADVIMPIAGSQSIDTVSEINNNIKRRPIIMVGVDSAQENTPINKELKSLLNGKSLKDANGNNIENPQIIQFSAMKKIDDATTKVLSAIKNKKDPNNANKTDSTVIKGFGFHNTGSLGNDTVGVSDAGLPYVKKVFPSWFKENTNEKTLALKPEEIYKNVAFQRLEYNGGFYISDDLNDQKKFGSIEKFKQASNTLGNKNSLFGQLLDENDLKILESQTMNNPSSEEYKKTIAKFSPATEENYIKNNGGNENIPIQTPLDGSLWSLYKNGPIEERYIKKEDELDYGK